MSNDSPNSHNEETQKTTELEKAKKEMRDKGYEPDKLAVFFLGGGEMIIGEAETENPRNSLVGDLVKVKNPKRYMRLQQMAPGGQGIAINIFVGDLDCVDGGTIQVNVSAAYWLKDLNEKSFIDTLGLLSQYFLQKMKSRAAEVGIVTPDNRLRRG